MKATKIERYFLSWHRHLYDTLGLYHGLAGGQERDGRATRCCPDVKTRTVRHRAVAAAAWG